MRNPFVKASVAKIAGAKASVAKGAGAKASDAKASVAKTADATAGGGWKRPFGGLRVRMALIFAGILLLTLTLASAVSGLLTNAAIYSRAEREQRHLERRLTGFTAEWYQSNQGWGQLDHEVSQFGPLLGKQVIIMDSEGRVIADSRDAQRHHTRALPAQRLLLTLALAQGVSGLVSDNGGPYARYADGTAALRQRLSGFAAQWYAANQGWNARTASANADASGKDWLADAKAHFDGKERRDANHYMYADHHFDGEKTAILTDDGATIGYLVMREPSDDFDDFFDGPPPAVGLVQRNLTNSLIVVGVIAGLGGIVLMSLLANRMLRPLSRLHQAAGHFGRGELDTRVPVGGPSELRGLAVAFNTMAADLERSAADRRNMTADVAHELRTPLSNIQGYLEAIRDGVLPADDATIAVLHQQSTHLSQLVDDLALLARAEAGALTLDLQNIPLTPILREAAAAFQPRAAATGVNLTLEIAPELGNALADATRLSQILANLIDNAITHTPANGTITITGQPSPAGLPAQDAIAIAVADTGAGMAADELDRVFDRFYRTDPSRARATGGSGLGLTIARQLAVAQGGALTAASEPGMGSTFTCLIPAALTPADCGE